MESRTSTSPLFRNTLFLACLAAFGPTTLAQDQSNAKPTDAKTAKRLEVVTVTGSHLSNPNLTSPTPLITLTAEDIKTSGATNMGDLLAQLPQFKSLTMGNAGRDIEGIANPNMRGLGADRTLTLINSRRFVGSGGGATNVDVNQIPMDWIERVEAITGGASAVYGADAIAGVTNFILKKSYQGVHLHSQLNTSQHGGFRKNLFSLTGGMNFAKDRGNVAVSVERSNQDAMEFSDRFGSRSYAQILTPDGPTDRALFPNADIYTSLHGGTFSVGKSTDITKRYVFDPDGSVRRQVFNGPYDIQGYCADCDHLHSNNETQLQPDYKRTTLSGIVHFDITPGQHLYAEGTYSHVDVTRYSGTTWGRGSAAYVITADNAFVTPALAKLMADNHLESIAVSRNDLDAGRRGVNDDRNTTGLTLGAEGTLSGDWDYNTSLSYGVSEETRHNLNNRIKDRFYASIDAVKDASGHVVCRSSLQPNARNATTHAVLGPIALDGGCIPTSIFGEGAISPAAARWFNITTVSTSRTTEVVGGVTVTNNNLFQMPFDAGAASAAAGLEFRRETSHQGNDPLEIAKLTFFNTGTPSDGRYDVREGYVEAALPLLTDHALVKNLTFDAAARFSDYSTIGHTKTWRWGLDWALDDSLRLRGTKSEAVRAPNISELYQVDLPNQFPINDPCSVSELKNARDPARRAANCRNLGVPAGWIFIRGGGIPGVNGGNPDLKPEHARTWTTGMVWTPRFVAGFGITVDYWHIGLTDAIASISSQDIVNRCVDSGTGTDNAYCLNAQRSPTTHELVFVKNLQQNINELTASGADIGAYYSHPLFGGKLRWNANASKWIAYTTRPFQDDPQHIEQNRGTLGYPAWAANLGTAYTRGRWSFNWSTRYFSSILRVSNESYRANPKQTTPIRAGAGFFNDAHMAYSFRKGLQIYAGVTNVLDRDPPVNMFDRGQYDAIGRAYYAGFNYRL